MKGADNAHTLRGKKLHKEVAERVLKLYEGGFYEEAAFNAFKVVDHRLRMITGKQDANPLELVNETFNPSTGSLKNDRALQSEREGFYLLIKGAFMSYRNPPAHRFVEINQEEAFDLIILANHFYTVIEEAYQRGQTPAASKQAPFFPYSRDRYDLPVIFQLDTDNDGEMETVVPLHTYGGLVEIFDSTPNGPIAADVERLGGTPGEGLDSVALIDVDNDGLNEVVCVIGYAAGSALMFLKYRNGRYEFLKYAPGVSEKSPESPALFADAQVSDSDGDGNWEVVSEPWGSVPDDLWPSHQPRDADTYDSGRVRNTFRWNRALNGFELLDRKLLYVGGR